jgi:O-antigen biosynthesis protein
LKNALYRKILKRVQTSPRKAIGKAWTMMRSGGIISIFEMMRTYTAINHQYNVWRKRVGISSAVDLPYQPIISVIMPTYNTPERWLRRAIDSVREQIYPNWELCIADDASTAPHVRAVLNEYAARDQRIKIEFRVTNGHISAASNSTLSLATGTYVALLDHDDEISPDALLEVVKLLNLHPEADFVYSDEDKIEPDGAHTEPFFKPDWSPRLLLCCNYITHFAVIRRELVEKIGGFRDAFVGSQDYDLFLRITDHTDKVFHVPRVLYSWRKIATSTASVIEAKSYAADAAHRALVETVERRALDASVEPGDYFPFWRIRPNIHIQPSVTVIISLIGYSDAVLRRLKNFDFAPILIADARQEKLIRAKFSTHEAQIITVDSKVSFVESLNIGAKAVERDYLVFLSPRAEPTDSGWLTALLEIASQAGVGSAGAKLISAQKQLIHAGITPGLGCPGAGIADIAHGIFYFNLKDAIREVTAVSGAAMMVARERFESVGGFDTTYQHSFHDVDLCLRLAQAGFATIYTPFAKLVMRGEMESTDAQDNDHFRRRWQNAIQTDPFYNIHLSRDRTDLSIHIPENK